MGKKSTPAPPPAPDYTGAAEKTAESSQEAQTRADWANRPTQNTPWGQSSWTSAAAVDPATGKPVTNWTQNITLTPEQQKALNDQMAIDSGKSGLALDMLGRAGDATSQPFDMSKLTQMMGIDPSKLGEFGNLNYDSLPALIAGLDKSGLPGLVSGLNTSGMPGLKGGLDWSQLGAMPESGFGAVEDVQKAMMSRMAPDLLRRREGEIQRLKAQGLTEGTEAWNNAMQNLQRGENDASQQALLGGMGAYNDIFNRGMSVRGQGLKEQLSDAQLAAASRGQLTDEQMKNAQLASGARGQLTAEQMADAQLASGARGQYAGERENAADWANALRGQKFGEQVTNANLTGQQRQQQIAEQSFLRSLPLNELNALLTGTQVGMPQMPGFSTSQSAGGTNYLGATNMADQRAIDLFNAQQAAAGNRSSGMMGMLGTIGGGMMGGPVGAKAGGFLGGLLT